uniref:Uncharacterized protein n=1 Tax=Arundo donax TaxID=35708 RepID=A0A0A9HKF9_ARUDO
MRCSAGWASACWRQIDRSDDSIEPEEYELQQESRSS